MYSNFAPEILSPWLLGSEVISILKEGIETPAIERCPIIYHINQPNVD